MESCDFTIGLTVYLTQSHTVLTPPDLGLYSKHWLLPSLNVRGEKSSLLLTNIWLFICFKYSHFNVLPKKNQPVHEVIINVHIFKRAQGTSFWWLRRREEAFWKEESTFSKQWKKCTTGAKATMVLAWMGKHASEPLLLANTGKSSKLLRR